MAALETEQVQHYTLQISSNHENIIKVETLLEELKEKYDISEEYYGNMFVALSEAVTNAIKHGNNEDQNKKVYINIEVLNNRKFTFTVADEGLGFDHATLPDPTLPGNLESTSGRGVFIIKNLADLFIYNKNGSEIEMQFRT
jgi:serine/threonine-protein kinase RsbW